MFPKGGSQDITGALLDEPGDEAPGEQGPRSGGLVSAQTLPPGIRIVRGTPSESGDLSRSQNTPPMSRKAAIQAVTSRFSPGTKIAGRYEVVRLIARGGMGCVFLGEQHPLGRRVALKILLPQTHDPAFKQRFFLEASVSSKLNHRNIVTVHDFGETPTGEAYMVMEFLDGAPLSRVVAKKGPLSMDRSLDIATQVGRAVRAAHRAGVVHRDLKPGNIMVVPDEEDPTRDRVRVLDFGLVKVFETQSDPEEDPDLTRAGMMLGSPRYMSPEQITCGTIDPRTDVSALGTIIFEMLTGRSPYDAPDASQIMQAHLLEPVPSAVKLVPDRALPPLVDTIIGRCLAKRPDERYASMDEVLEALERLTSGAPVSSPQVAAEASAPRAAPHPAPKAPSTTPAAPSGPVPKASPPPLPEPDIEADPTSPGAPPAPLARLHFRPESLLSVEPAPPEVPAPPPRRRLRGPWVAMGLALLSLAAGGATLYGLRVPSLEPVQVTLTSTPGGAEVSFRGRSLGVTPLRLELPRRPSKVGQGMFVFETQGRTGARPW
ncbi:MAG: serine/threonine-protein kinase, partial [Myxococcota bacterium]